MDIKKRINARKVVLAYYYQHCFFSLLEKELAGVVNASMSKEIIFSEQHPEGLLDANFLQEFNEKKAEWEQHDQQTLGQVSSYLAPDADELVAYYIQHFFDQRWAETIELEYVHRLMVALPEYEKSVIDLVNQHSHTLGFEKMDVMDQALFLLAFIEFQVLATPRSVVINEVIELAKRYSDPGAPKLLNGVLEKILSEEVKKAE